jgi:hypothetical protein
MHLIQVLSGSVVSPTDGSRGRTNVETDAAGGYNVSNKLSNSTLVQDGSSMGCSSLSPSFDPLGWGRVNMDSKTSEDSVKPWRETH